MVALREVYPECPPYRLAKLLGFGNATLTTCIIAAKGCKWWRNEWVDEVRGAIVAKNPSN